MIIFLKTITTLILHFFCVLLLIIPSSVLAYAEPTPTLSTEQNRSVTLKNTINILPQTKMRELRQLIKSINSSDFDQAKFTELMKLMKAAEEAEKRAEDVFNDIKQQSNGNENYPVTKEQLNLAIDASTKANRVEAILEELKSAPNDSKSLPATNTTETSDTKKEINSLKDKIDKIDKLENKINKLSSRNNATKDDYKLEAILAIITIAGLAWLFRDRFIILNKNRSQANQTPARATQQKPTQETFPLPDSEHLKKFYRKSDDNIKTHTITALIINLIEHEAVDVLGSDLCNHIHAELARNFADNAIGHCKTYNFQFVLEDGKAWRYLLYTYPFLKEKEQTVGLLFVAPGVKTSKQLEAYFQGVSLNDNKIGKLISPAIVIVNNEGGIDSIHKRGQLTPDSSIPTNSVESGFSAIKTFSVNSPDKSLEQSVRQTVLSELKNINLPNSKKIYQYQSGLDRLSAQLKLIDHKLSSLELELTQLKQAQSSPNLDLASTLELPIKGDIPTSINTGEPFKPQKCKVLATIILDILVRPEMKEADASVLSNAITEAIAYTFDQPQGVCRYYDFSLGRQVSNSNWDYLLFLYPIHNPCYGLLFAASGINFSGILAKYFNVGFEHHKVLKTLEPAHMAWRDDAPSTLLCKGILETS